jgi:beta-N-acetylhexosaminidase
MLTNAHGAVIATNPANPSLGIRSFGDDPMRAAPLVAATVRGLRSAEVAATVKHFPGKGEAGLDTHHQVAVIGHDRRRLDAVELIPFRAGLEAGAELVMTSHASYPALSGEPTLPATLSPAVLSGLLRDELGFDGVAISDAINMRALGQGAAQAIEAVVALRAGVDALLLTPDDDAEGLEQSLVQAAVRRLVEPLPSLARIGRLRRSLRGARPDLSVVGSADHRQLARELAERSVTLVRDDAGLLPLRLPPDASIAAVMPRPADLTPADTSARVEAGMAAAVRRRHPRVTEHLVSQSPAAAEIAAVRAAVSGCDLLLVGTISASLQPGQAELVRVLLATGVPTVTIALRTPFDLTAYPEAATHCCTYSILPPSLDALADALWGAIEFRGRLPVSLRRPDR